MKRKITFHGLIVLLFMAPRLALSQNVQGSINPVEISSKYYNSIVKILLYDSAMAKTNPAKAYLARGSGFFVSPDGYIFTNRHVIDFCYHGFYRYTTYNPDTKKYDEGFDKYTPDVLSNPDIHKITYTGRPAIIVQVYTNSRGDSFKLYHAQVVALDTMHFDGAILKINSDLQGKPVTESFHPVPIGNSDSISQGQDLCLIGFPAQYNGTYEEMLRDLSTLLLGKHSGYDFKYNETYGYIKTDAKINSGNSGGPVFGPSDKVIGMATAAFEKTDIGLIGGIDAMYYVAQVVPGLNIPGLSQPEHKPGFSTASLYKPLPLPTPRQIKKANNMAGKTDFMNSKAYMLLGFEYGLSGNNNYSIGNSGMPSEFLPRTMGAVSSQEYRACLRIVKPTFLKQRNNLVGYFFNFEPGAAMADWTNSSAPVRPASITNPATVNMGESGGVVEPEFYASFGFSYTYLFTSNIGITAYYGPGINLTIPGYSIQNGAVDSLLGTQANLTYQRNVAFFQSLGLAFKLKAFYLAIDYRFINSIKVYYQIPDNIVQGTSGSSYANVPGTCRRNSLSLVIGVVL